MSLLERIVIAHRCRSTHHYIAMDALPLIGGPDAEKWRSFLLAHNEELLKGAKAPDSVFKDFKNHVLHVGEGEWGGARDAAMAWYAEAVAHLQNKKWGKAVYALGVLSHYYADPIQPFHTGQTEEEGAMHRALEWSIAKSRSVIKARIGELGYPEIEAGDGPGFVSDMVRAGADKSHQHYYTFIDHYNLDVGAKHPEAGLDQTLIDITAELVAYASAGLALLFGRAFAESAVAPPKVHITVPGYLATLDIPLRWITKKLDNAADKRTVAAMYKEYRKTGKVIKNLPEDDKAIRRAHARQVLRRPLREIDAQALKPLGQAYEPRPEHVGIAKLIARELEPTEEGKQVAEEAVKGETEVINTAAIALVEAKPAKRKKRKASKPKARIAARGVSESTEEQGDVVAAETVEAEAFAPLKTDARKAARQAKKAERAEKKRLEVEHREQERTKAEETARLALEQEEQARLEAKETARLAAEQEEQARIEVEELARVEAEEAERLAADVKAKEDAQAALRASSQERLRKAKEEKARLEAEDLARIEAEAEEAAQRNAEEKEIARFEAREAAEFERLKAEEEAELARMEAEEAARIAEEEAEFAEMEAEEAERRAAEEAERTEVEQEMAESEQEFTLEELAAFDTNLTEDGDRPSLAPPIESFFDSPDNGSDRGRSRSRLMPEDPVIDAPSIGKKTARRLNRVGIFTVEDLLKCDSEEIVFELDVRHIDEPTLDDWKAQAVLMIEVPGLRVHDAQILVGAGIRSGDDLANASATKVFHASMGFLKTSEGARVVRDDHVLRETEVNEWIDLAKESEAA